MATGSPVVRLRRAERVCWLILLGPVCAAPATGASVTVTGDDALSVPAAIGGTALLTVLVLAFFLAPLINEWRSDSLSGREADERLTGIDWTSKGWKRVRDTFHAAGLDTARLHAVSSWSPDSGLKVVHIPQPSPGLLGRMEDWGARLQRRKSVWVVGAAAGFAVALLGDRLDPSVDDDALLVPLLVTAVAIVAAAGVFVYHAFSLNVRRPTVHVIIPRSWRALLRTPVGAVLLRHEISHLRHGDPMRRRYLRHVPAAGKLAVWFDSVAALAVTPMETSGQTLVSLTVFTSALTGGLYANSRARRLMVTLMEMRADAEALAHDPESAGLVATFLARQQDRNPTPQKAARLRALTPGRAGGPPAPYSRAVAAAWVFAVATGVPALGLWTGVLDGVPS
ncbi:hypothetical protein [Streptomyces cucumeris]|uniref:hypothetical protein n=1 Tax=Streptomyces cucumeris TaxID=2962890 RepID=UPI0020C8D19C|nr:hypothetical protein [Streptomyces sp. NEAU-Y11]MCP9211850.1 hypothetical protein [Streptomyces sp. NEAU-Y11]